MGVDSRWSLDSTESLADGVYDIYAVSSSDSTPGQGVGREPAEFIEIITQGPQILGIGADLSAKKLLVRVRSLAGDNWGWWDQRGLTTIGGREVPILGIGTLHSEDDPKGESTTFIETRAPLAPGEYLLTLTAATGPTWSHGIFDNAGNPLDGAFNGTFPSGGSNTGQDFRARLIIGRDGGVQVFSV